MATRPDVNIPIPLDFDGDGKTDFVIYDQTAGEFYAEESGGGNLALPFGTKKHATSPV